MFLFIELSNFINTPDRNSIVFVFTRKYKRNFLIQIYPLEFFVQFLCTDGRWRSSPLLIDHWSPAQ